MNMRLFYTPFLLLLACADNTKTPKYLSTSSLPSAINERIIQYKTNHDSTKLLQLIDSLLPSMANDPCMMKDLLLSKAGAKIQTRSFDSATHFINQAVLIKTASDSCPNFEANVDALRGNSMYEQGRWDSALFYCLRSYYGARRNKVNEASSIYRLTLIYGHLGDWDQAMKYALEGYNLVQNQSQLKVYFSGALSAYYDEREKYDSALFYWRPIMEDTSVYSIMFDASKRMNMGYLLVRNDQLREGMKYMLGALPDVRKYEMLNGAILLNLAIGYAAMKRFDISLNYLDSSWSYSEREKDTPILRQVLELKSKNYAAIGDFKRSAESQQEAYALLKNEFKTSLAKTGKDLETKYAVKEKEENIRALALSNTIKEKVSQQQKTAIISLIVIILLSTTIAILVWRRRQLKLRVHDSELKQQLLRSQMKSHFIFNSLGILQSLIRNEGEDKALDYLSQFSKLLRVSLENARHPVVPMKDELQSLIYYMNLQFINFDKGFNYVINFFDGWEKEGRLIPPMLLQPFVENAVIHGISKLKSGGVIDITADRYHDSLIFTVEDNGPGLTGAKSDDRESLSTKIIREHLSLLEKQTRKPASLTVVDKDILREGPGVRVRLEIPFIRPESHS